MTSTSRILHSDPDILGGTPVFIGTRVPIKTLLDYLEAGDSLDEFLDHYLIFYTEFEEFIWIVAIAHSKRTPDYWRRRQIE